MRCAINHVLPPDDPLTIKSAAWLGRDSHSGMQRRAETEGLTSGDHSFFTALPRRAGFPLTLKPPSTLHDENSLRELERRLTHYPLRPTPVDSDLQIILINTYFALVPVRPDPALKQVAANIVAEFDGFRRHWRRLSRASQRPFTQSSQLRIA